MGEAESASTVEKILEQSVPVQTLTDKEFDAITRKLGAIIKGRLSSWTPQDSSHEGLLFE